MYFIVLTMKWKPPPQCSFLCMLYNLLDDGQK